MDRSPELLAVFWFIFSLAQITAGTNSDFVCYHDEGCADNDTRPVFVLGPSAADCCGTPRVRAAWEVTTETCTDCGPAILRQMSPQFVALSPPDEISLEVEATGYSAITWLVNGTDMHDFERISLERFSKRFVLSNTTLEDAGVYEADVHTLNGTIITAFFYVLPFREPSVVASVVPRLDGSFLLRCDSTGFPPPMVEWFSLNGSTITTRASSSSPSQRAFSGDSLYAELDTTSDYLEFTCLATTLYDNTSFTTSSTVFINEERPAVVGGNGPVVTVTEGQTANITCSAQGQPLPSLKWQFHGTNVLPDSTITIVSSRVGDTIVSVLMIGAVSYNRHRGLYMCLAESRVGEDLRAVELHVRSPPNVTVSPTEVLLHSQQPTQAPVFVCVAVGNGIPEIRWESNGESLRGVCTGCDMRVAGESCEMGEAGGEADILGEAVIGEAGEDQLTMGDSLDMSGADFEDLDSVCVITTYATSEDRAISELSILSVSHFGERAEFTCTGENGVENIVDSPETASAELIVLLIPVFEVTPQNKTENVGRTVLFVCQAKGLPIPRVVWQREGELLNTSDRTTLQHMELGSEAVQSSLSIRSVMASDRGLYSCVAENEAGRAEASFQLTVLYPPIITTPAPSSVQVTVFPSTLTTSLRCISSGYPPPNLAWSRGASSVLCGEGAPLVISGVFPPPNTTLGDRCRSLSSPGYSELMIVNPRPEDEGTYTCSARNSVGETFSSLQLLVHVDSTAVVDLVSDRVSELEDFSLSCLALSLPSPRVSWLKDNQLLKTEELTRASLMESPLAEYQVVSSLTITRAEPGRDDGIYQCRIDNNPGPGVIYDSISITVEERDDCQVSEGSPCLNGGECMDRLGGYSCYCTANFTGENCSVQGVIPETPTIIEEPVDVETEFLETVELVCEAQGKPDPIYSWFLDGLFVRNTTEPFLRLEGVEPGDRGLYHCVATNSLGSSQSRSGLLTIDGVFQYSARISCLQEYNYTELVEEMSVTVSGDKLVEGLAEIISITARPVRPLSAPSQDQVLLTVVANGTSSREVLQDLRDRVDILASDFNCSFTDLQRFDGCPEDKALLSAEFGVFVSWPESEIGSQPVKLSCPCGRLNATQYGNPNLTRVCGGTYTYGAEWEEVDPAQCNYTDNTYKLCSVTQFTEEEQAAELASATERATEFRPLDFAIAALIMRNLAEAGNITSNIGFQLNFTRSYSNLLNTGSAAIRESQREFLAASNILGTLRVFGKRLNFENSSTNASLEEKNIEIQVEDIGPSGFDSQQSFKPDLRERLYEADPMDKPLDGAAVSLASELLSQLSSSYETEALRVFNVVQESILFVTESLGDSAEEVAGNLVISARIFSSGGGGGRESLLVEDLPDNQAVIVSFNLTEALNDTCVSPRCVFWDDTNTSSIYGSWSEEGCTLLRVVGREITCRCNHLTHFGVLMDISPDERDPTIGFSLQIISYVGCIVSIVLLTVLLFTYISSRKLRAKVMGQMLINSCTALIGVYATFLLAIHGEEYRQAGAEWFCHVMSAVLQYFLLSYFLWTALEAFQICLKLVKVFGTDIRHYVRKSAIIAWGVPLVIVAFSAGFGIKYDIFTVTRKENIDSDVTCGTRTSTIMCRADGAVFYAAILAPFVLTYSFNLIVYFIIVGSLGRQVTHKTKGSTLNREMLVNEYKRLGIVAFFLAVMFGLAWIFAVLVAIPNSAVSYAAQYLFSIFIGFQGLLYFVMHVVRSPDARRFWATLFYKPCPGRIPAFLKTWTTTSPQPLATSKPANLKSNPIYSSQDNLLLSSPGESAFNTLQRPPRDVADLATSPSSYSLASQTLQIDFTLPTIVSDDEASGSSMDLQDLTDIINTKFSDPNAPGVAVSQPRIPISIAHEVAQGSPLARQTLRAAEAAEKEYRLRVENREDGEVDVMDLAYDSVYVNENKDSSTEEEN